jgi:hypothetical protein
MYFSKQDYNLLGFEKAKNKLKKYTAVLENKETKRKKRINFGAIKPNGDVYEQYKDTTGLGLYTKYNHNDVNRRTNYRKRHSGTIKEGYYSAGQMSLDYLW